MARARDLGPGPDSVALHGSHPPYPAGALRPIQLEQSRTRGVVETATIE
jgi:hypothetical protein